MKIHHKILHHIRKYHHLRKKKDEVLPEWKHKINEFNKKYFNWLEKLVEGSIPWFLVLFLFVLFAEFADQINFFKWGWLTSLADFAKNYNQWITFIDRTIVTFFSIDIYFSFFKKAKIITFLKHYFLDIIAVFPFGLFIRAEVTAIQETQGAIHLIGETEKEVSRLSRIERISSMAGKFIRPVAGFARSLRLYRLIDFFKPKHRKNKNNAKKKK
jgi:hypothetical protein